MGREQGADFYDERLGRVGLPLEESPWLAVYALTADLLPLPKAGVAIADLGCGTGRLAKLLQARGHERYWGVDFSPARIEECRQYVPGFAFDTGDLFAPDVQARFPDFGAFVALEVLEHVEDDLPLLDALPGGATVVFSVPNYDSDGHVRTFAAPDDAVARYGALLHVDAVGVLPRRKAGRTIFVLRGKRR